MARIRLIQDTDLDALYGISLATGFAGGDAAHIYEDKKLLGHIYSAPYARLSPDLALVVEDNFGVAGFAVGTVDTEHWEALLEREWWPELRRQYPDPDGAPADWTMDQRRCAMIHHPERTPTSVARRYPAHMHLNLLPRQQRRGVGGRLLEAWIDLAFERGARAMHVGLNRTNSGALTFWKRQGFEPLTIGDGRARTAWLGRRTRA